ncbi:MAG: bestrophin family ion channel, partial [Pseudomonadota bacterium]
TSLRFALRVQKSWEIPEVKNPKHVERFNQIRYNPERVESLEETLKPLLSAEDYKQVLNSPNKPSAVLAQQSEHLSQLKEQNKIWEFSYLKLQDLVEEFYTLQGKSERIKNFPYPRQYFTLGVHLTWAFILLLPYAMIPEF